MMPSNKLRIPNGGSSNNETRLSTSQSHFGYWILKPELWIEAIPLTIQPGEVRTMQREPSLSAAVSRRRDGIATHTAGSLDR